jgi:hypothetical protein
MVGHKLRAFGHSGDHSTDLKAERMALDRILDFHEKYTIHLSYSSPGITYSM